MKIRLVAVTFFVTSVMMAWVPVGRCEAFSLVTCILKARGNNPDLMIQGRAVDAARAQVSVAESSSGPVVSIGCSAHVVSVVPEMNQPAMEVSTPAGAFEIPGSGFRLGDYDTYSIDLDLTKIVYAGGRLTGAVEQAQRSLEVVEMQRDLSGSRLDRTVSLAVITLTRLTQLRSVAEDSRTLARRHAEDIQNLENAGVVTGNEVLKAELRVSEAETGLLELQHQIELQAEQLRVMTGWRFETPEQFPDIRFRSMQLPERDVAVRTALDRRLELELINRQIQVLDQQREMILMEKRPVVSVFGRASYGKPGPDFIRNEWIDSYQAGLNCTVNVWDYGRIRTRAEKISAELNRLHANRMAVESSVALEVVQAMLGIQDADQRITVAERALMQAEENFRLTADRFSEGSLTNTDYLDAELALSRSRSRKILTRTDLNSAWVQYLSASGRDILEEVLP
jgi:outer membrane protein